MSTRRKVIPILIILMSFFGLFSIDNTYAMDTKTISNVVVFTKFKDDTRDIFNAKTSSSDNWTLIKNIYNKNESNGEDNSFKNYIKIISEGNLEVNNYFPQESSDEKSVATYTLNNNASYYQNSDLIIQEVINAINDSKISYSLDSSNLSNMNSGFIDNLTIIVQGRPDDSNAIASHKAEYSGTETINGLRVSNYNIIPSSYVVTDNATMGARQAQSIIAHEFLHVLGLPDLYRKTDSGEPVGMWDIMGKSSFYLQYPLSYLRLKQGWIKSNTITKSGSYTLTAVSEKGGNKLFEIKTPLSDSESIFLEYRKKNNSTYALDHGIPSSGLLMYRVDNKVEDYTNIRGKNYIYVYRPNVTDKDSGSDIASDGEYKGFNRYYDAALEPEKGENEYGSTDLTKTFQDNTLYYSDGQNSGIKISNVKLSDDKNSVTFNVDFANYNASNNWKTVETLNNASYGDAKLYRDLSNDNIYVSYTEGLGSSAKVIVKKWTGSSWKQVGGSLQGQSYPSIATYNNSLYLVTQDFNSGYLYIYQLENNNWKNISEYKTNYPKNINLIESNNTIYLMYEETTSGLNTKLTIKDIINNKIIAEKKAKDFGNPSISMYNNKLYLAYSSYFDSNNNAKIELYDLSKKEWKTEITSTISGSNIHIVKKYENKIYTFIGKTGTSPILYSYDGTKWSEDKIDLMTNYLSPTINIINNNVYISYIDSNDNKSYLLKVSDHKVEIVDDNLGKNYSYLYMLNDKENMYAITLEKNSSSINIKTKKIETDNSNSSTDDKKNDNNNDNENIDKSKNGFIKENGNTYYYVNGKKITGRKKIDGIEYYFDNSGIMHGNILFLGDSLTDYYNLSKYYKNELVINSGIAGNSTDDILNDMHNRVYKYNPSKIFLLIGTNDIVYGKDVNYITNNINKIIDLIRKKLPNCKIYLESLYPINNTNNLKVNHNVVANRTNDVINQINTKIKEIPNITYINIHDSLVDTNGNLNINYTVEGLHINDSGYITITNILNKYINNPDGSSNIRDKWYYDNNYIYYYKDGELLKGIYEIDKKKYLFGITSGKLYTSGVAEITYGNQQGVYYTNSEGIVQTGFQTIRKDKYYFNEEGKLQKGIVEVAGKKYLLGINSGKLYTSGVAEITYGNQQGVYYTNSEGIVQTGFQTIGKDKYYFNEEGKLQKGIVEVAGKKYLLGINSGKLYTSGVAEITYGNQQGVYYTNSEGIVQTGFQTIGKDKYYFNEEGKLQKGIVEVAGRKYLLGINSGKLYTSGVAEITYGNQQGVYYTNSEGIVQTGFQTIGKDKYYFNEEGKLQKGIVEVAGKKYLLGITSGKLYTSGLAEITYGEQQGVYYTNSEGIIQTGFQTIGKDEYYFDEDGKMRF